MEEATILKLEQLATKLGTTIEYLWTIMINQAQITAITHCFIFLISIIIGIVLIKNHYKYMKMIPNDPYRNNYYEDSDTRIGIMVTLGVLETIFFVYCLTTLPSIINGFANPEYWALNEILTKIN